jgi:hypothetical protein
MTSQLEHVRPVASPGRIGQGTAVEQSRAIAEVQAQVIVAQQMPRDITRACREMLRSCAMKGLADKAFYRYKRAGTLITGPSVQLARELARSWGNVQYGITELRRDDDHGQSEMLAFAWDLETNTRSTTTFIVQHVRDTTNGSKVLTDQRDIYENNANNGARRLREMIFAILPGWYTEDAVAACYAALAGDDSDGATVADRAATAAGRFGGIGVTPGQLENKLGAPQARWSPSDLAQLAVIFRSIERGETTADAEFGPSPARVTAADITGQQPEGPAKPKRKQGPTAATPAAGSVQGSRNPPAPGPANELTAPSGERPAAAAQPGQVGVIRERFSQLGYGDDSDPAERDARLRVTARLAGHEGPLGSTKDLTQEQAARVIRTLRDLTDAAALTALLEDGEVPGE